jgi:hypothetical protein
VRPISLFCFLLWSLLQASSSAGDDAVRVLFVGNSYSFQIPKVFAKLAESKGKKVVVEQVTKGGWSLEKHAAANATKDKISAANWDYVVLQEQSQIPSFPKEQAQKMMVAAAKSISDLAKKSGAEVLFFETWGRRDGDTRNRKDDTFEKMQGRLTEGYAAVAKSCGGEVVPVGQVWAKLKRDELWSKDGSHPSKVGNSVAAAVFYARIFGELAQGDRLAGLEKEVVDAVEEISKTRSGTR